MAPSPETQQRRAIQISVNARLPRNERFQFSVAQSARAGIADGNRFADEGWRAFVIDLRFYRKSETRLHDYVLIMRRCAWADTRPVGAETKFV